MKIRIYSPFFPYPPTEGAFQVIYNQATYLANQHSVELVVWKTSHAEMAKRTQTPNFLSYDSRIRALSLEVNTARETFTQRGLRVGRSFFSPTPSPAVFYYPNVDLVERKINAMEEAELGIYHYSFASLWLKEENLRREKKNVCMMHNLEADLFAIRSHASKNPIASWVHHLNSEKLRTLEAGLYRVFDELWFLSDLDRVDYLHRYKVKGDKNLRFVPPTFDPGYFSEIRSRSEQKKQPAAGPVLGLLGAMNFPPHELGVRWLINEVFPRLAQANFQGQILLGGKYALPGILRDLQQFSFVKYLGFVEHVEDFYAQLDGILVPHLAGSGVRMKLLEALAAGIPVLCHPGALAPLTQEIQEHGAIAKGSTGAEWSEVILNPQKWQEMRRALPSMPKSLGGDSVYSFLGPSSVQ